MQPPPANQSLALPRAAADAGSRGSSSEAGFTLIETLAALTVLAVTLTSIYATYNTGLRSAQALGQYLKAQILAESILAEVSVDRDAPTALRQGQRDGLLWSVTATAKPEDYPIYIRTDRWQMYHIVVTVQWDRNRSFSLNRLQLARAKPKARKP